MIKQLSLTFAAVLLLGYIEKSHQQPEPDSSKRLCKTRWLNRDHGPGDGDWETLELLRQEYPGEICLRPREIEAVVADTEIPAELAHQIFYAYNTQIGFICRNEDQIHGNCYDYKVRFVCPCN